MYTALVLAAALAAQPDTKQPPAGELKLNPFVEDATRPDDKDSPLRKLQKERARERASYLAKTKEVIRVGNWDMNYFQQFIQTQATLAENLTELMDKPADKIKCYEMRVAAMKEFEKFIAARVETGTMGPQQANLAKAARIDAEIDLLKVKGADDAEALIKQSITDLNTLADALEKKAPEDKLKSAAQKLKGTMEKLKVIKVSKEEDERLKKKYEKELMDPLMRLLSATLKNPEGAKSIEAELKVLESKSP